jgi:hypothetical protein
MRRVLFALLLLYISFDFADPFLPGVFTFDGDDALITSDSHNRTQGAPPPSLTAGLLDGAETSECIRPHRSPILTPDSVERKLVWTRRQTYQPSSSSTRSSEDA